MWQTRLLAGGMAMVLGVGCFGSGGAGRPPAEPQLEEKAGVDALLGKRVRVMGEAQNAKLGAVVVDGDLTVYLIDFREWPKAVVGKQVEATGVLARDAKYATQADMSGAVLSSGEPLIVLHEASYLLLEE